MEECEDLRALASRWSLLADDKLLNALDKLHQKVLCACLSSSERLDCLSENVRRAEQSLTMLNDRFASLSNRQFVERRVYEDDADIQTDTQTQTNTQTQANTNCESVSARLSRGVRVLRERHISQQLVGSDESDDDVTEVLKLRDMYSERPLPHIIGTAKWRGACFPTESQSESEVESSDEEDYNDRHTHNTQNSLSVDSGSLREEPYSTQQDLEEEIQSHSKTEDKLPYIPIPQPTYVPRPLIPRPAPDVFRTEPPPPDRVVPDIDDTEQEEEDEDSSERKPIGGVSIFGTTKPSDIGAAILNRKRQDSTSGDESDLPTDTTDKHNHKQDIFDDLFAKSEKLHHKNNKHDNTVDKNTKEDIKIDTNKENYLKNPQTKAKVDIFNDDFDDIFTTTNTSKVASNVTTKAVTNLFDDDDDDMFKDIAVNKSNSKVISQVQNRAKSIFDSDDDELFGTISKNTIKETANKDMKIPKDDEIKTKSKELSKTETVTKNTSKFDQISKGVKSIFDDSDDELFLDDITTKSESSSKYKLNISVNKVDNTSKETKGLFSDSDDELFTDIETKTDFNKIAAVKSSLSQNDKVSNDKNTEGVLNVKKTDVMASPNLFDDEEELLFNESRNLKKNPLNRDMQVKESVQNVIVNDYNKICNISDIAQTTKPSSPDIIYGSPTGDDMFNDDDDIFEKDPPKPDNVVSKDKNNEQDSGKINKVTQEESFDDSFDTITKPIDEISNYNKENKTSNIDELKNKIEVETKLDVFSDIFNEGPPEFEKPKESKKSKNVNALFDDDSDDESLFFKKNDNFDDPPETDNKDHLFGLFLDEPPNIDDIDFMKRDINVAEDKGKQIDNTKDIKIDKSNVNKNELKEKVSKQKNKIENIFEDDLDDIFKETKVTPAKSEVAVTLSANKDVSDKTNIPVDDKDATELDKPEPKKVGKLKPMNINIDINTLKPGASLIKKNIEQTDGQTHAKINEELHSTDISSNENIETKLVKSVSFEENVDTNVLDNKLSKERAKIQVKRRPSTRKARREAARVSVIQFQDDVTDGSSNIDEVNKSEDDNINISTDNIDLTKNVKNIDDSKNVDATSISNVIKIEQTFRNYENCDDTPKPELKLDSNEKVTIEECKSKTTVVEENRDETVSPDKSCDENLNIKTGDKNSEDKVKDVKSKVVYILNDEDIFNTKSSDETKVDKKVAVKEKPKNKVLNIIDDDDDGDDLFKYMAAAGKVNDTTEVKVNKEITKNTKTREKQTIFNSNSDEDIFKTTETKIQNFAANNKIKTENIKSIKKENEKSKKKSLFGDSSDSDEELFKPTSKTITKKPTVFDSDSESELFGSQKRDNNYRKKETVDNKEGKREVMVKGSLFGDDDDDEDLFTNTSKDATDNNTGEDPLHRHKKL